MLGEVQLKIALKSKTKAATLLRNCLISSEPAGIQTPSLLIRSQMLYSVKLQALIDLLAEIGPQI